MSRRTRTSKTNEQIRNEQVALVLGELEKDLKGELENFKIIIEKKDEQLNKFSKILKATKIEYQKLFKENKDLKNYILKQQQQQQQQQEYQKQKQQKEHKKKICIKICK